MPGATPDTTCPHCGMVQNIGNIARHIRICLSAPDTRHNVLIALTDPADPTRAVSRERYRACCKDANAPSPGTLLRAFGGTWPNVCAAFGLSDSVPFRVERPHTEPIPRGKYRLLACPHCGEEFAANKHPAHVRTCVDAPEIHEAIAAALKSKMPGFGITESEYRLISHERGIPSRSTLMRCYGVWADVLAAFGLAYPERDAPRTHTPENQPPRMTLAEREAAAIAAVDKMSAAARAEVAQEYDNAHTFHGYTVRDLPGVTVNGKPCVAIALR